MKNEVKTSTFTFLIISLGSLVLYSCVPNFGTTARTRTNSSAISGSATVGLYQGRVLLDNPIILSKNSELSESYDLNNLLSTVTITNNNFLQGNPNCYGLEFCFEVRETKESPSALQTTDGKWSFISSSAEFLQVNTFYHLNNLFDLFFSNLSYGLDSLTLSNSSIPTSALSTQYMNSSLIAFANCDAADNAFFDPATQTLCFGYLSEHSSAKWAQDSTVIYHEAGHFFQKYQLNLRNSLIGPNTNMGYSVYDEAGSIGEGLSDFFSYYVNGRTHFAEWAAGRFLQSSRPMTESDPMHVPGLSADSDQRLSYPQFLNYNPNEPTIPAEDIHYSGMILSHYLVALTEDLEEKCFANKREASNFVMHLITETLAEHGDLTSKGTNDNPGAAPHSKINLNPTYSSDWFKKVNPINYRSFMQTMAKNLKNNLAPNLYRCNGGGYSTDKIESLIDDYGLLLFRTYNESRSLVVGTRTPVNSVNRKKSVLISKNLLTLDPTPNSTSAFVIDNRAQIKELLTLLPSGSLSGKTLSDLGFNNGNGKVSPGEVVALALNLYNNSNSPMGGVQILANDWNHADSFGKPYRFPSSMSNDQWPLLSEGATEFPSSGSISTNFAPICFIQSSEASSTKWISQKAYAEKMALNSSYCLDKDKPNECFIRAVKNADTAYYSKINPKSTWGQTLADPSTGKAPTLTNGNVVLFEVSKHIPPGTVVDCRLRVRFTNCEDCFHDSANSNKDFSDVEYNGPKPFKIIHLEIPIID